MDQILEPTIDQIRSQVRRMILSTFLEGKDPSLLRDDVSLERSHIVDSVRSLEIVLFIEQAYGITVDNQDAVSENLDSVDNIVRYVATKRGQRGK